LPLIEFICPQCSLAWAHRSPTISSEHNTQVCKRCGATVARQGLPSSLAIQRAGTASATTDHIVGQDAAQRWDEFHGKKEARDSIRKELGTQALSQTSDGTFTAASQERLQTRKQAYKFLNE